MGLGPGGPLGVDVVAGGIQWLVRGGVVLMAGWEREHRKEEANCRRMGWTRAHSQGPCHSGRAEVVSPCSSPGPPRRGRGCYTCLTKICNEKQDPFKV